MNQAIHVKKLVSLNPTKFKKITLGEASKKYFWYVGNIVNNHIVPNAVTGGRNSMPAIPTMKTFTDWLETEI
jgi:hypothetical protein